MSARFLFLQGLKPSPFLHYGTAEARALIQTCIAVIAVIARNREAVIAPIRVIRVHQW